MTTNEYEISAGPHGFDLARGPFRIVGPLPTEQAAREALEQMLALTETEALVLLSLDDHPVAVREVAELTRRDAVQVAVTINDLAERGLVEWDGADVYPTEVGSGIAVGAQERFDRLERAAR
jgi:predicted transcriptional regulator